MIRHFFLLSDRHWILIAFLWMNFSVLSGQTYSDIIIRGDTIFQPGESKPYSGKYVDYYPGKVKVSGHYQGGLKDSIFKYYDESGTPTKVENYKLGKKHGEFISYYQDEYFESKETYVNDQLDGECFYWAPSGELEKVLNYNNGKLISKKIFPIDSSIWKLMIYIEGEENTNYQSIRKEVLCSNHNLKIHVAAISYIETENSKNLRTVRILDNYKIVSGDLSTALYIDPRCGAAHWDIVLPIKSNLLTIGNRFCYFYPQVIYFYEICIENPMGYKYFIPTVFYQVICHE